MAALNISRKADFSMLLLRMSIAMRELITWIHGMSVDIVDVGFLLQESPRSGQDQSSDRSTIRYVAKVGFSGV